MKCKKILLFFFFIPLFLSSAGNAAGPETRLRVEVFPRNIRQGDVFLVRAMGPPSLKSIHAEFQGEKISLSSAERQGSYEALIGVDLNAKPAKVKMKVMAKGDRGKGYSKALTLKVERVDFPVQRLTLPRSMVDLDPRTLERVNRESKRLKALFGGVREERLWKGAFSRPVEGEVTTGFGLRRVINGQRKSPHTGVDLRADEGTPVLACNSGRVALVDEFFFSGKSVILDHGEGLYSMYFHLSQIAVGEGDRIHTGNLLGRVGSTGRSTGPHLHWGIILRGARVDPLSFLRLTKHLQD